MLSRVSTMTAALLCYSLLAPGQSLQPIGHSLRAGRLLGGSGLPSRPEHIDLLLQHLGHVVILAFYCTLLAGLQLGNLQVQSEFTSVGHAQPLPNWSGWDWLTNTSRLFFLTSGLCKAALSWAAGMGCHGPCF